MPADDGSVNVPIADIAMDVLIICDYAPFSSSIKDIRTMEVAAY